MIKSICSFKQKLLLQRHHIHTNSLKINNGSNQFYTSNKNNHYNPFQFHHRYSSNSTIKPINFVDLTDIQYNTAADNTMDLILDNLESLNDTTTIKDYDIQYNSGVLNLSLGKHGQYVINKQPPNKQIWLSSPSSGPKRFALDMNDKWMCGKSGMALDELLNGELSVICKGPIDVLKGTGS